MSVSGVDSSSSRSSDAEASRKSQEVDRKETEDSKRYSNEITQIRLENQKKLKALEEQYKKTLDMQQQTFGNRMTEKEKEFQRQIDEMREMNRQRYMNQTSHDEDELHSTRANSQQMLANEKRTDEAQKKVMNENFENQMKHQSKEFKDATDQIKALEAEGIVSQRQKLEVSHQANLEQLKKSNESTTDRLGDQVRETEQQKNNIQKDMETGLIKQKKTMGDNYDRQMAKERATAATQIKHADEDYSNGITSEKARYASALEIERDRNDANFTQYGNNIGTRQQEQIDTLKKQVVDAKEQSRSEVIEEKRLMDLEKKHLMGAVSESLKKSEQQREGVIEVASQQNADQMFKASRQNSDLMHDGEVRSRQKINMLKMQHEDEITQQGDAFKFTNEKLKLDADMHDRKMSEANLREKKIVNDFYQEGTATIKRNFDDTLQDRRLSNIKERNELTERFQNQFRQLDSKARERFELASAQHERQMEDLKANHRKDVDSVRRDYEIRLQDEKKLGEQNLQNQKMKYESQITNMKEQYDGKLHQAQKSVEEEKINLAKNTK